MSNLTELLNARHNDLDFELGMLMNNRQLLEQVSEKLGIEPETNVIVNALEQNLLEKLSVDLEEIAEDEEIDVEDIDFKLIDYALGEAFQEAKIQMKSYLQLDHTIATMRNLGATKEEVEGLYEFKNRLEKTVFDRYDVTEEDLKNGEE